MTATKTLTLALVTALLGAGPTLAATVTPHDAPPADPVEMDVWLDHEDGAVYRDGQRLQIEFRTSADAYVAIYNVDSMGEVNLLYPRYGDTQWVPGGRVLSIPAQNAGYDLVVDGPKGIEYVVGVASRYPLQLSVLEPDTSNWNKPAGLGLRITGDPSDAIWEINEQLTWNGEGREPEGYASDVAYFYTREQVPYPRYLVYDWYPERYWDPYWDPYVSVHLWFDWHWNNHWCSARWYHWGHRPSYDHWYRVSDHGPRERWKSVHEVYKPSDFVRSKPTRPPVALRDEPRSGKPTRAPSVVRPPRVPSSRGDIRVDDRPSRNEDRTSTRTSRKGDRPSARPDKPREESKPKARPERPREESRPKAKPESKPEPKPQAKPEQRQERKQESKPASKPEQKPDARPKRR